jgi:hypothetical protein
MQIEAMPASEFQIRASVIFASLFNPTFMQ